VDAGSLQYVPVRIGSLYEIVGSALLLSEDDRRDKGEGSVLQSALRCTVMGVDIDCVTEHEVSDRVIERLETGGGGRIVTPNVDILRQVVRQPQLRELIESAEIVVADGAPILWASRLQGTPLPERVPGSDLIWSLSAAARDAGRSIFLLGGPPGAAEAAADRLRSAYEGLVVAGCYSPPLGFEHSESNLRALRAALDAAEPDITFCGFGFPKQEQLMSDLARTHPRTWFVAVGAGIAFAAGTAHRAPEWMQRSGLEWLHRLIREPRRLFRRYVVHGLPFAVRLAGRAIRDRRTRRNGWAQGVSHRARTR
jgi:N-acetylglucosaminyldiphosphoundecaprenol N-acetyl-beta-D-mannosaminyltransferase